MYENVTPVQQDTVKVTSPIIPQAQPAKDKKLLVLMVLVNIITIIIIGYLFYQNTQLKKQISQSQSTPIASTSPTILLTVDPTVNWKTYTNETYSYELKVPENLNIVETNSPVGSTSLYLNRVNINLDSESYISIAVQKTEKFIPSYNSDDLKEYKPIVINGVEGKQGIDYGNAYFLNTYLYGNMYTANIGYIAAKENQSQIDLYNQILSTFKFKD